MKKLFKFLIVGILSFVSLSSCDDNNSYPYLEEQYSYLMYEFENGVVTPLEGTPDEFVTQYTNLINDRYIDVFINTYRIKGITLLYNFTRISGNVLNDNMELDYKSWKDGERNMYLAYYESDSNTPYGNMYCRYIGMDSQGNLKYEADIIHSVFEYKKTTKYYLKASFTLTTDGVINVADIHNPPFQL